MLASIRIFLSLQTLLLSALLIGCGGGSGGGGGEAGAAVSNGDGEIISIANASPYPWTIDSALLLGDNLCQLVANGGINDRADHIASAELDRHIEGNCVSDRQLVDLDLQQALSALAIAPPAYTDVAIFMGVNDYLHEASLQDFVNAYAQALDEIEGRGLHAHCIIPPSVVDHPEFEDYRQATIDTCLSRNINPIDSNDYGLVADYGDGFHYSGTMHRILADILKLVFAR